MYITLLKQFNQWKVLSVIGSIMVDGVLTCGGLLHSEFDLKAAQMNMQRSLIQELILEEFERGYDTVEATKNICWSNGEDLVVHSTVARWFKKILLDNQASLRWLKSVNSEARLQVIKANPTSSTQGL